MGWQVLRNDVLLRMRVLEMLEFAMEFMVVIVGVTMIHSRFPLIVVTVQP